MVIVSQVLFLNLMHLLGRNQRLSCCFRYNEINIYNSTLSHALKKYKRYTHSFGVKFDHNSVECFLRLPCYCMLSVDSDEAAIFVYQLA